jgi:glycosyltransferase involved in cell wall biosynthesis
MRIAFYAPLKSPTHPVPSGDRRIARLMLRALKAAGHEVRLASRLRGYEGKGDAARQGQIARAGARAAARLIGRYRAGDWRPDLWFTYHVYHKAPDHLGPRVAEALAIPYALAEATVAPTKAKRGWADGLASVEASLRRADRVFVLNAIDAECAAPFWRDGAAQRILPFLDAEPFRRARLDRERLRAEFARRRRLPRDVPWLLAVAMMRPGDKAASYRVLADALAKLKRRDWRLIVVGDGPARAEVRRRFAGFGRRVVWLGARRERELPALAAVADAFVWPAMNEALGMAILEAQAAGVPAVVGRAGAVPDIVENGRTGFVAPAGDARMFAAALAILLDDPVRRAGMSAAALGKVAALHDLPAAAGALDRALRPLQEPAP